MTLAVLLSAGTDPWARAVRAVTRSGFSHVALVNLTAGELIEARSSGVRRRPWSPADADPRYRETLVTLDAVEADDADRAWTWAQRQVGRQYGTAAAISTGLRALTGLPLVLTNLREYTCAELVAVALLIAGREIPAGIVAVSPGDVAEALLGSRAAG